MKDHLPGALTLWLKRDPVEVIDNALYTGRARIETYDNPPHDCILLLPMGPDLQSAPLKVSLYDSIAAPRSTSQVSYSPVSVLYPNSHWGVCALFIGVCADTYVIYHCFFEKLMSESQIWSYWIANLSTVNLETQSETWNSQQNSKHKAKLETQNSKQNSKPKAKLKTHSKTWNSKQNTKLETQSKTRNSKQNSKLKAKLETQFQSFFQAMHQ